MKKIYAKAPDVVPLDCDYITPGKLYQVLKDNGASFHIIDDEGDESDPRFCCWEECAHLGGGDWERVEIDDTAPGSRFMHLTVTELEADLAALGVALQAKRAEEAAQMIDGAA